MSDGRTLDSISPDPSWSCLRMVKTTTR